MDFRNHFSPKGTVRAAPARDILFLVGICMLVVIHAPVQTAAQPAEDVGMERLHTEIARLETLTKGGAVGVGAIHLESGTEFYYNRDLRFPMASTYKVPIAVQLFTRIERGELRLSDMITIEQSDLHPGSGTLSRLFDDPGVVLSIHNLLELMLLISDNSATDLCLEACGGPEAVTKRMHEIGIENISVDRPTLVLITDYIGITKKINIESFSMEEYRAAIEGLNEFERGRAWEAFNRDQRDTSTPYAMAQLLKKVWFKEILTEDHSNQLVDILKRVETGRNRIKGILPPETTVFHKTGTIGGTTNDVGIVELPGDAGNVVTVIFTKEVEANSEIAEPVIAQVARAVYDYFLFTTK